VTTINVPVDIVYVAVDNKQITVLVGLDFSVAFDTVSHDTLLERRLERNLGRPEVNGAIMASVLPQ